MAIRIDIARFDTIPVEAVLVFMEPERQVEEAIPSDTISPASSGLRGAR